MPSNDYSNAFLAVVAEANKQLTIAISIEGLSTVLTSGDLFKKIVYGDPIVYGQPGIVYGGLIGYPDFKALLSLEKSGLTIQQKVEPEQGRASVSMMSLAFIDKDQFMSALLAPGLVIPDILGAQITVRIGFPQISYPDEYTIIFRGRVSQVDSQSGLVTLQMSDPNMVRRQQIFYMAKTFSASAIGPTDTTIPVVSVGSFNQQILGPDGTYDPAITTYVQIDDEVIQYPATGISATANSFVGVTRGARSSVAASHDSGAEVNALIQVEDHMIDMALKYMLSGWQGPYLSSLPITSFVQTNDPITGLQNQGFVITKDAVVDYGISPGDYLTVTGASTVGNNGVCKVVLILNTTTANNRVIVTDKTFTLESSTSAVFSVRSQYDTYPDNLGVQMPATEVDVARHQYIKNTFMSSHEYSLNFFKNAPESSEKTFIESELYLPFGCYSLTRLGRCSMQLTHAPIADQRLQVLDKTNVINPQDIKPSRGVNNRKFFNQINFNYDYDDGGVPHNLVEFVDTNSLNIIGVGSVLPFQAEGVKSALTTDTTINRTFNYILSRYKNGAILINIEVNFATGVQIEAGDVIEIADNGFLQISNFLTGKRNLGAQLFEVIDRSLSLSSGKCSLQVVSGIGAGATDRFATFSPSSVLTTGTTQHLLVLEDSFGTATPGQEVSKWTSYLGLRGLVHDTNYNQSATCILGSVSPTTRNAIIVSGISIPASAGPFPGWVLDIDYYPTSTDPLEQAPFKISFCHWDPQVVATSGISDMEFEVAASGIDRFQIGLPVLIHNSDFSVISAEANVLSASTATNIVTVESSLGFTPTAGNIIELIGFADGGGAYRII